MEAIVSGSKSLNADKPTESSDEGPAGILEAVSNPRKKFIGLDLILAMLLGFSRRDAKPSPRQPRTNLHSFRRAHGHSPDPDQLQPNVYNQRIHLPTASKIRQIVFTHVESPRQIKPQHVFRHRPDH